MVPLSELGLNWELAYMHKAIVTTVTATTITTTTTTTTTKTKGMKGIKVKITGNIEGKLN